MTRIIAAATLTLTLLLGACAAPGADTVGSASDSAAASPAGTAPPSRGSAASEFPADVASATPAPTEPATSATTARAHLAVTTLGGVEFDVAATEGRPLILWFWAPWCTICRAEAPHINEVVAELEAAGSPVTLVGVPGRGEVPEMEDFVSDTATGSLTHLVDSDGALWRHYGVVYQPAFALLSPNGEVEVINGALGADGLREAAARVAQG